MTNVPIVPQANAVSVYTPADDFAFMRPRDITTPRMFLMQPTSPTVIEGKFRPGEFVLNDETFCPAGQKTKMVMLLTWLQWIEWNPDRNAPQDKRMLNKSFDPMGDLAKQAEAFIKIKNPQGKEVVKVTEYYNCIAAFPGADNDYSRLASFGFARSSHKDGKKLLNRLFMAKHAGEKCHLWENEFEIYSRMETKDGNRFFVPTIGLMNRIPDHVYDEVKGNAETLRQRRQEMQERMLAQEADADNKTGETSIDASAAENPKF